MGGVIDDIAVVRSMWCHEGNHFPAVIETCTGHRGRAFDHPIVWQLGELRARDCQQESAGLCECRPALIARAIDRRLPGRVIGSDTFSGGKLPIPNLNPPKAGTAAERERQMQVLQTHESRNFAGSYAINTDIRARPRLMNLPRGCNLAPDAVDFLARARHIKALYGIGESHTEEFGQQLLLARRLAEHGVRFIQICHAGGGNGAWDAHGDMKSHEPLCRATDKPIAGLIRDLKQRGMLEETLVVWSSEFGRTPWSQNTTGRDHNPKGYTAWMAGGGVKGGIVHGATDEVGYKAEETPHYYSDLHATILHQVGIDHTKMVIPSLGPVSKLVEDGGPINEIIG